MNPILSEPRERVTYRGIQTCGILNKKPFVLVNDSEDSTVKFDPNKHELSVNDLHKLKNDIKQLEDNYLVLLAIGV